MSKTPWWKGAHGEWYVAAQMVLLVLIFFGPRTWTGWPVWTLPFAGLGSMGGGLSLTAGVFLLGKAISQMGSTLGLPPLQRPSSGGFMARKLR